MRQQKGENLFELIRHQDGTTAKHESSTVTAVKKVSQKDIAIIGMGVKFPLADDVETFWHNLRNGIDCIRKIPEQRKKDVDAYLCFINRQQKDSEQLYEDAAYLDKIDGFDYRFFRISPKEASLMDPNQRLFLQTAWTALEDAGYGGGRLEGSRTGVYVGFGGDSEYKKLIADVEPSCLSLALVGNLPPIIASRLSYLLDLKGPNMLVNTVCSSSLVAVHLACQGIRSGECELAVAGGVQVYVLPLRQAKVGIESSDFKTKSFDDSSDGTGSGEGTAAVLLKPLNKAIKDRDHIYAVIKGGAINQDGRSIGISAPNPVAQADVICRAWKDADLDPEAISYIEAHGTGTKLGDPIEIEGIQRAFARYTQRKQFCALGSVKSNMGHLDNSAGIAGLIKAVLALKYKEIPPTLHFHRPNRKVAFHQSPVYINDMLTQWETHGHPRRCGVSSFSFSGTNCHLVLEEAPTKDEQINEEGIEILTLSADTEQGLKTLVSRYKQLIKQLKPSLSDLCFTANSGRGHYSHRLAFVLNHLQDFQEKIRNLDPDNLGPGDLSAGVYYGVHQPASPGKEVLAGNDREITREQIKAISQTANRKVIEFRNNSNNKKLLHQVCELYVRGAEIDWDGLYHGGKRRRVSLPTYPFAAHRCWLQIPDRQDERGCYYTLGWKQEELTGHTSQPTGRTCLILKDKRGLAEEIAGCLRQQGAAVIEAEVEPTGYKKLLAEPQLENLQQVIHLQTFFDRDDVDSVQELENQLQLGVYSLFHLVRALQARGSNREKIDMVLISALVHEVTGREKCIHPGNAAFFGLGKVVNLENFNLKCRAVDIDENTNTDLLIREIIAGYSEYKVAYRSGKRYVEELISQDTTNIKDSRVTIKPEGVYIITGGTGGLGLEIASHLASKNKVNIALINRTPMPKRGQWQSIINSQQETEAELAGKIKVIRQIEKTGSQVVCCRADVARTAEIEKTLCFLRNKFGKINGIVHCAAVGSGQAGKLITDDNIDVFKQVMAPKVQGTWLLDRLTRKEKLDFFVVFSGAITLIGGIGSGSYTAANTYLNSFTAYRNKAGQRTFAMGWAVWEETLKKYKIGFDARKHLFDVQSSEEIIHAFWEILGKELPMVIFGKLNHKSEIFHLGKQLPLRLSGQLQARGKSFANQNHGTSTIIENRKYPLVQLKGRNDTAYTKFERQMAQIFGEFLGYREIGIGDNFYELGGDSIIAAKMIQAANQRMAVNLAVEDLLRYPTIEALMSNLNRENSGQLRENRPGPNLSTVSTEESPKGRAYLTVQPVEKKEYYPISEFQTSAYILSQLKGGKHLDKFYNLPTAQVIEGNVDKEQFREIFQKLSKRHEALRTSFIEVDKHPVQRIHDDVAIRLDYIEVGNEKSIDSLISDFIKPFDMGKAPLFRVQLAKLGSSSSAARYLLLMDIHHSISDGQSWMNLLKDFMVLYRGKELASLEVQFKDFIRWRGHALNRAGLEKQAAYWLGVFKDGVPELNMPLDSPRPWMHSFKADTVYTKVGEELRQRLNRLASRSSATLFMVLLAAFYVLLSKLTGDKDIVVGIPAAGRHRPQLEPLVGSFVNILPLRTYLDKSKTFRELVDQVKANAIQAFENQDYFFGELVQALGIQKQLARNPVYDVMFAMQIHEQPLMELKGLRFTPYNITKNFSDLDLNLDVNEKENQLFFRWEYCKKIYKKETIAALAAAYNKVLESVIHDNDISIKDITPEL